ncbi:MAG: YraN family protein [Bacteroidales bacterium]|nr:YraN family protein [Bacteroidales bacterium]
MARHNTLGTIGEDIAAEYLIAKGYTVRERNWRMNKLELDIVAEKDTRIIIVEVKTRALGSMANPLDAITPAKIRRTVNAANAYMRYNGLPQEVQFDIITIVGDSRDNVHIEHIADAFRPPLRSYR